MSIRATLVTLAGMALGLAACGGPLEPMDVPGAPAEPDGLAGPEAAAVDDVFVEVLAEEPADAERGGASEAADEVALPDDSAPDEEVTSPFSGDGKVAAPESFVSAEPMLSFTSSDAARAERLSDLLHLYMDPARNPSGQTLDNSGGNAVWIQYAATAVAPLGARGSTNLLNRLNWAFHTTRQSPDGFIWTWFNAMDWPFPSYKHSAKRLRGWEFNGTTREGWSLVNIPGANPQGGLLTLSTGAANPRLISPAISVSSSQAAFVRIDLRCYDGTAPCASDLGARLWWQTSTAGSWSTYRSMPFSHLPPEQVVPGLGAVTYMLPVYQHAQWRGSITKLRVDPVVGKPGRKVVIDRIILTYDSRKASTSPNWVRALHRYYFSSRRADVFTAQQPRDGTLFLRARRAVQFLDNQMEGRTLKWTRVPFRGHDGRPGKVGSTLQFGRGIQSTFFDGLPIGHDDAHTSVGYQQALLALADLEEEALRHPEWGVPAHPYDTPASLRQRAAEVAATISTRFWVPSSGRLAVTIDADGVVRDYGHLGVNLEAAAHGVLPVAKGQEMLRWVAGERIVAGDTSQGGDIYHWVFAPRTTTRDVSGWFIWPMYQWFGMNLDKKTTGHFSRQVQNGGGWFWQSYYDVLARLRYRGADDAWARLRTIADWYAQVRQAGGFRAVYPAGVLQGCESSGAIGLDCEFIENALVPLATLYGFLGYDVGPDGLYLAPALPSTLTTLGTRRLHHAGHFYDVDAYRDPARPLVLQTHPETGVPGFPNAPHSLKLRVGRLVPNATYRWHITNLGGGSSPPDLTVTADAAGVIRAVLPMPATARAELLRP